MSRRESIESLREELERLTLASANIRRIIEGLELQEPARISVRNEPSTIDRDGNLIRIGSRVTFLTRGRYNSTGGVVTRFSRNQERVFTEDPSGWEYSRAPYNVRVISDDDDQ